MATAKPPPLLVRNLQAGQLRETFLVSAVASLLAVRFFLSLTGFPKVGGGGLHIVHMLWGGGLMVTGLLFLLAYLGERIRRIAAVIGGVGFGLFVDELGKFISSDNNYFYRPAIALIYAVFVLFFLRLRTFERHRLASEDVFLANALVLLQDAAIHDLNPKEKTLLLQLGGLSYLAVDLILLGVFDALIDDQHRRAVSPSPRAGAGQGGG
jgi:hypothetical protein